MTTNADFKRLVRERMARTGERYTTARRALLGSPEPTLRARHDQTTVLAHLLADLGITDPRTDAPFTEAWLLGLGGGISAQVNVFDYAGSDPTLYVGTRCNPQYAYDPAFVTRALEGLGLTVTLRETGGAKTAARHLTEALVEGPVLAWVGREALHDEPEPGGALPWVVLVRDVHDDHVAIEDARRGALEVPIDRFAAARSRIKKAKHRLITVSGTPSPDPKAAVPAALRRCVDDLAGRHVLAAGFERSFGLQAVDRWATQVTAGGAKGWRRQFAPGRRLVAGCRDAYRWIESVTGGGGFRPLYAAFLDEAGHPELAAHYRTLAEAWTGIARRLVDDNVPLLAELRRSLDAGAPAPESQAHAALLTRAETELPDAWGEAVYPDLAARLTSLAADERRAAAGLEALAEG